ncbi:hypothetical protein Ddye_002474 [Dipteronia dyeriana]|uniref:Uncharacterized protein n=1 Tax=Dipteronia dyeriana TaxID=168575 RepID=A0AAD9XQU7_9ROSI|nr:hypothetical protein Ddye_002474 [Dipteronia dyeriana]
MKINHRCCLWRLSYGLLCTGGWRMEFLVCKFYSFCWFLTLSVCPNRLFQVRMSNSTRSLNPALLLSISCKFYGHIFIYTFCFFYGELTRIEKKQSSFILSLEDTTDA